ncbi:MAG TPA: HEAT repeat domain-containing protein, partial [Bacteroidota bacterium]|nr:HEAT repeat domain-containing protein [Bacteroidota bacterium]
VRSYTMYGVDRNLRIEALRILASNWKTREDVVKHLIGFLTNTSFHIRRAVIGFLGDMETPLAIEPLQAAIGKEADARLVKRAKESLEQIQKAHRQK